MFSLLKPQNKYHGYEKTRDLEASDELSSVTECIGIDRSSSTRNTSKIDARVISDAIIGLSDGMTVPFALTAGLSAIGDTRVVIFGGFAELIAGAISMGLGGYLGAKSEEESYHATLIETQNQATRDPSSTPERLAKIFSEYDVPASIIQNLTSHMSSSSKLPDFFMRFEHGIPEPAASRAMTCALTIALGYFIGGFIPLFPYLLVARENIDTALRASIAVMIVALFAFGYGKTCFVSGWKGKTKMFGGMRGGGQMVIVGGLAAGSAMSLVKLSDSFL